MFEITTDHEYIYRCLTDPRVWRMSSDDNCPPTELFFIPEQDHLTWVKAGDYGLFLLIKQPDNTHEVHVALNKFAVGLAVNIAFSAIKWGFETIPDCNTLIAKIPAYNHLAQGLAKRAGFKLYATEPGLFVKDGIGHDMHIYILNKENVCPRQQAQRHQ